MSVIKGKVELECNKCGDVLKISASDLEFEVVASEEREMGAEILYSGGVELQCTGCNADIRVSCDAWDYPPGTINHSETTSNQAKILRKFP